MSTLIPVQGEKRRERWGYAVRRWLRIAGVRPVLGSLAVIGGIWLVGAQLPVQRIEQQLAAAADHAWQQLLSWTELRIELGRIRGSERTTRAAIAAAADLPRDISWLALDTEGMQHRVIALPWVQHAEIQIRLPGRIDVRVTEQVPEAVWHTPDGAFLLTGRGENIAPARGVPTTATLPVLQGAGADVAIGEVLALQATQPAFFQEVGHFERVGMRRWDATLRNGVMILLPEGEVSASIDRLVRLNGELQLLARELAVVDLRNPHSVAVRFRGADLDRFLQRIRRATGAGQGA